MGLATVGTIGMTTTTVTACDDDKGASWANITFASHTTTLNQGGSQTISATSTNNKAVTLTAAGTGKDVNWHFYPTTGALVYDGAVFTTNTDVTITAHCDDAYSNNISICLLAAGPTQVYQTASDTPTLPTVGATATLTTTVNNVAISDGVTYAQATESSLYEIDGNAVTFIEAPTANTNVTINTIYGEQTVCQTTITLLKTDVVPTKALGVDIISNDLDDDSDSIAVIQVTQYNVDAWVDLTLTDTITNGIELTFAAPSGLGTSRTITIHSRFAMSGNHTITITGNGFDTRTLILNVADAPVEAGYLRITAWNVDEGIDLAGAEIEYNYFINNSTISFECGGESYAKSDILGVELGAIPRGTLTIERFLYGCSGLQSIDLSPIADLPNTLMNMGGFLQNCSSLESIDLSVLNIPTGISNIGNFLRECDNISAITWWQTDPADSAFCKLETNNWYVLSGNFQTINVAVPMDFINGWTTWWQSLPETTTDMRFDVPH